jgi:hypothetical protein
MFAPDWQLVNILQQAASFLCLCAALPACRVQAVHAATCQALLAILEVPEAMRQLRTTIYPGGSLQAPLLWIATHLFLVPHGDSSEAAVLLLATLLRATAELPASEMLGCQPSCADSPLIDTYHEQLARVLLELAKQTTDAPMFAATLARCGFGQLALQLARARDMSSGASWVGTTVPASA